jgi:glycosyltransferase involved in cell wall biosynthesis
VLSQTIVPSEIIVIDDGSTDATGKLVRAISSPRVVLESQENAGPGPARNRGIEIARSEWIAFLDSDDLWAPDHAERLRNLSLEFPNANVLAPSHCEVKDAAAACAQESSRESFLADFLEGPGLWPIHTSAVAMRRGFVRAIGGFPRVFPGEDVDLWFRSALASEIAMTSSVTSYYVRREDSIMAQGRAVIGNFPNQPLLASMDKALADPRHRAKRDSLLLYRERVYRMFLRQAIAQADSGTGREIVRMMRERRIAVPFFFAAFSAAPQPLLSLANQIRRTLGFKW